MPSQRLRPSLSPNEAPPVYRPCMKTPRQLYLVTSKKAKGNPVDRDQAIHTKLKHAQDRADYLNKHKVLGVSDWKPEKYNKGD